MDDYDVYVSKWEVIEKENNEALEKFKEYLENKGLKEKTIQSHLNNVEFYLNTYLFRVGLIGYKNAFEIEHMEDYFGYFFIRKCMWSTPYSVKATLASMKKFNLFMFENKMISKEQYNGFVELVKESKEDWIQQCDDYNEGRFYY